MKKKTYKQMQNQLYREIKRRIIAEHFVMTPQKVKVCEQKIDVIATKVKTDRDLCTLLDAEMVKKDIARKVFNELYDKGDFLFYVGEAPLCDPLGRVEIECRINVVKPII